MCHGRSFLKQGSIAVSAAALTSGCVCTGETKKVSKSKILNQKESMAYRKVPGTTAYVSVLSLGGSVKGEEIRRYAFDKGVNLFHVSENYFGGESNRELGKILRDKRDQMYIALNDPKDIDLNLKQLNTDYVDFIMFPRHDPASATNPKIIEKFEKWKKEGKVRWAGLACHEKMKETTAAALKTKIYSLIMPALDQSTLEIMAEELREAPKFGAGIMPMKSFKGIKHADPKEELKLQVAYMKKLLANPAIVTINKGVESVEKFDAYMEAVKGVLTSSEDKELYRYAQANRQENCMMCGECTGVCPNGIAIPTLIRCADYYHDQCGWTAYAEQTYAEISPECRADQCQSCGKCEEICPNRLAVREHLSRCREIFS